jgi:hypothetical protein
VTLHSRYKSDRHQAGLLILLEHVPTYSRSELTRPEDVVEGLEAQRPILDVLNVEIMPIGSLEVEN